MQDIIPITGTVVDVAPDVNGDDVMYPHVVIRRKADGTLQEFINVYAVFEVAGLIDLNASGHFIFWQRADECRLAFFYSDTGARAVDYGVVREYLEALT